MKNQPIRLGATALAASALTLSAFHLVLFPSGAWAEEERNLKEYRCRLVDASSKEPVGSIRVLLWVQPPGSEERSGFILEADSKGSFQAQLPPGGTVQAQLLERRTQTTQAAAPLRVPDAPPAAGFDISIAAPRKRIIEGRVLNPDGTPAAQAAILLNEEGGPIHSSGEGRFTAPCYAELISHLFARSQDGKMAGIARVPESGPVEVRLGPVLDVPISVRGDDGKPVSGFSPVYFTMELNGSQLPVETVQQIAVDSNGNGKLAGLCPGAEYRLNWYYGDAESYSPGDLSFTALAEQKVDVTVKRFVDNWKTQGNLCISDQTRCEALSNYCLDGDDRILACDERKSRVLVVSAQDELQATWQLPFAPQAIVHRADGTTVVAGPGRAAILDRNGRVLINREVPGRASSGLGYSGEDIFLACRDRTSFVIYRLNAQLEGAKLIVQRLRGCCGQMDITARDGIVYAAANCDFAVIKYDREGQELGRIGQRKQFSGCCEPKNVCFDRAGNLYTAESEDCRIQQFSPDGKPVREVGKVGNIFGCVRVTIAISKDGSRYYMLDTRRNIIRLLMPKTTGTAPS